MRSAPNGTDRIRLRTGTHRTRRFTYVLNSRNKFRPVTVGGLHAERLSANVITETSLPVHVRRVLDYQRQTSVIRPAPANKTINPRAAHAHVPNTVRLRAILT